MRRTMAGIISADRKARNTRSRPGKRSRAKAYAAVALVKTWPATTQPATIALFRKNRANGTAPSAAA